MSVAAAQTTSVILGWIYFLAWSVSFYPQVILNYKRKSVEGLSIEFVVFNIVGFTAYSINTLSFFWSGLVQEQYRERHNGQSNLVVVNDVFFAVHAWVLTVVTGLQVLQYKRPDYRLPVQTRVILLAVFVATAIALVVMLTTPSFQALDMIQFLGYVKLTMSLIKYLPQMWMNFRTKSTVGWSIHNILLDFTGGLLSFVQLFLDAWIAWTTSANPDPSGWAGSFVTGNVTKLGLSLLSMGFDIIFLVQHYVLYRASWRKPRKMSEETPILNEP